ncbi:MAG TPA: pitrilysin family protein [Clostridia bacterium]|nr:pitrilysin family protein [Clostridia bacterium]
MLEGRNRYGCIVFKGGEWKLKDIVIENLDKNTNLYVIPDKKFKTIYISYCFHRDLDENYTYNALVPAVLKRGCEGYENQKEIGKHLEEQYGALFDVGVQKRGERQILRFTMDVINEDYVGKDGLLAQAFYFLNRIITKPVLEDSMFREDYVDQEKENLKNRILAMINDKMQYSMERCIQEMCQGEKYARYALGSVDELSSLDPEKLYEVYRDIITGSPLDIFVVGDVDPGKVSALIKNSLDLERSHIKLIPETIIKKIGIKQREVVERMDVSQAKLNIGFRTNVPVNQDEYFPLVLYAGILGGGPHSKLFINVREKSSLAYYAFARLEKYKGLMLIGSGIDQKDYEQALEIIMEQIADIEKGRISDMEFTASVNAITTSLRAAKDEQGQLVDYYLGNAITGARHTLEDFIREIQKVKPEAVVEVSKKVKADTVYLLRPNEGDVEN